MRICSVCGNNSHNTKYTRPELSYHQFPTNENSRKIWFKVFKIDHYSSKNQCVCGDHFSEVNYKSENILFRNTIPKSYDQKLDQNGLPNNYTFQINDVETTGHKAVLPMEQNIILKEEDNGNTVVNNFKVERRSCRKLKSTRNNDMDYYEYLPRPKIEKRQIPTVIKTDVKAVLAATKDRTSRYKPFCSVKKCFNRYSKELSFFGYPRDLILRKKWIAKSGLVLSPTATNILYRYKVCSAHFDDDCFKNTKLKNRLRPGAIPTLLVEDDLIESRNIPSTNSSVNSGFVHINKPSCSSSNYIENVESKDTSSLVYNDSTNQVLKLVPSTLLIPMDTQRSASNAKNNLPDIIEASSSSSDNVVRLESKDTPLLVYNTLTNCSIEDFEPYCSIPGCISNITNTDEGAYLFSPTIECVNEWSSALGIQLSINSYICERHFRQQDLICEEMLVDGSYKVVKLLVYSALPIPYNTVPTVSNAINNLPDNTDKCSESNTSTIIDNFPTIDSKLKEKLKNISGKNSLSITLEPNENSKVIKPSVDFFKKTSAAIKTPVFSKCISLARIPDTHNSNSNKNKPTSKTSSLINNMMVFKRQ